MNQSSSDMMQWKHDKIVLCTAEAYGFGPAAALWSVYTRLRHQVSANVKWHFVGARHSLSLHVDRETDSVHGWDVVHRVDVMEADGVDRLQALCRDLQPFLLVTAVDHIAADVAIGANVPVIVIDPILWWWSPELPPAWHKAQLILAADFFGVKERVAREQLNNVQVVPPLAPAQKEHAEEGIFRKGVVLNLGGLRNPVVPAAVHIDYARLIYQCARDAVDSRGEAAGMAIPLQVWASPEIVQSLPTGVAVTVTPEQAQAGMRRCALLCCTPGLGNLFDAATCARSVLLLPPTNETQALQAESVQQELKVSAHISWHSLTQQEPLDFHQSPVVSANLVSTTIYRVRDDDQARARLSHKISTAIGNALDPSLAQHTLSPLISMFGVDDGSVMAAVIAEKIRELDPQLGIQ